MATVDQQPVAAGESSNDSDGPSSRELIGRYPAIIVAVVLLALSTLLVLWARTRPGFDPYGWLVWGHQTLAANLNTNAAPSWKPLPYLFVTPYALLGHYELWLWMITSVAIALSGVVFAARIAYRLTSASPERRWPAFVAGAFAGLALLGIADYSHYILSFQSDPMIVSLSLGAIDCHLSGRHRWAFVLGALAGLGRPEIWLFLGLYSVWAWRAIPSMRGLIIGGWIVMALLWFGIPALSSRSPFVAGSNALGSGRRLKSDQVFGTIGRFLNMNAAPIDIAGLLAIVLALWRRDRALLLLTGIVVLWVLIEIAFSLHGWPGLQRYMFGAGGVLIVLAGVFVGRLLNELPAVSREAGWAAIAIVAVLVVALAPKAISHARTEHKDLAHQRLRTKTINLLTGSINRLGGPSRFKGCGEPLTRLEYQTILAWNLHVNVATVGYKYGQAIASGRPIVLFTPEPQAGAGWVIQAVHQRSAACRTLPAAPA